MFQSYIKIALRSLAKNKLYAVINVVGLAVGLAMYLLSGLITDYERNHDHMFANRDNIYTVASYFNPAINHGDVEERGTYMALVPLLKVQMPELKGASRGVNMEVLLKNGDAAFYQEMKFVDEDFTHMFDFDYLYGSRNSLTGPNQVILTESTAMKYLGKVDVVGETLTLSASNGDHPMQIVAVIRDVAGDSHFNSSLMGDGALGVISRMKTIDTFFADLKPDENWGWLSSNYWAYLMTDGTMPQAELQSRVNEAYRNTAPKGELDVVSKMIIHPLADANLAIWFSVGMPVIELIEYLGLLVLIIAIINYANLATAQNMGRFREVGLRKTLGADRKQLLIQFMMECQSIVFIAMILSVAVVELAVPMFNSALDKSLVIDYTSLLPWLIVTTLIVGAFAGAYPAYMITKTTPSEAIKNVMQKGRGGIIFRNLMIGTQFVISIIMMGLVMVVYAQNLQVQKSSDIFPKSQILNINRVGNDKILERKDVLHREITALADVEIAAFGSQVPFMQQNWGWDVSREKGDFTNKISVNNMLVTHDYLKTYNIPIVAGRDFSRDVVSDQAVTGVRKANVVINELAAKRLGFASPEEAVGGVFFVSESNPYQLTIVGVMADRNILGLQNHMKPFVFRVRDGNYRVLSVRLKKGASASTITKIEDIWKRVNPDFPLEWSFLDAEFEESFKVMRAVNKVFAGFSVLALALALFGLFGLAAFMAEQRTREIGVRKVMGAGKLNIVQMLILQFSRPVVGAILLAVPITYMAAERYLEFFADKIDFTIPLILLASILAVLLSWGTIAVHAIKVARSNPIYALRYE